MESQGRNAQIPYTRENRIWKQWIIDKIGIRDGNNLLYEFTGLNLGPTIDWQTSSHELTYPENFNFGLGVSLHVNYVLSGQPGASTHFQFASIGLLFVKGGIAPPKP